jgi:uncharacterized membrane protein/5-hydroxyisourate hydrolase-like protein (transthyretin family)
VGVGDFAASEIGVDNYYRFELVDRESANTFNTTAYYGPNLTASGLQIQYVSGNESGVNRSGSNSSAFLVRVYDSDNSSFVGSGVNVSFWATTDGASYASGNETTTNASGYANVSFNPSCSYGPAKQKWVAGITDARFTGANSSEYNVSVIASFNSSLLAPAGERYLRGSNVSLRVNLTDDCGAAVPSASTNISSRQGATYYACTPVNDEATGAYNCSWSTSSRPASWYDVALNSSKPFFDNYTRAFTNAFFVETAPVLSAQKLNTSAYDSDDGPTGGYSESFNFTINVTDEDSDGLTVRLWARKALGAWQLFGTRSCSPCNNTQLFITKSNFFACNDIASWDYFWNATDAAYESNTTNASFNIEADDMQMQYYAGNAGAIWRNGSDSAVFSAVAWDVDKQANLTIAEAPTVKAWITLDGAAYDSGNAVGADAGGFFNYSFNPSGCGYGVGVQRWKMGTTGNSCYKDANSSAYNVTINASLSANVSAPVSATYNRTSSATVRFEVLDECGSGVNGTANALGFYGPATYSVDAGINDQYNGTYNYSFDTTGKTLGWYNVTANAEKAYYAPATAARNNSFRIATTPSLVSPTSNITTGGWGEAWKFQVDCQDVDADVFNVTLWKKQNDTAEWSAVESQNCSSTTGTTLDFAETFSCGEISPTSYYKFNATDSSGFGTETSQSAVTVEKDDVTLQYQLGQSAVVDREGTGTALLRLRFLDADKANSALPDGTNTTFYVSTDGSVFDAGTVNSTSSGNASYYFDPGCGYSAGEQKWQGGFTGNACYKDAVSTNYSLNVTGQLKVNVVTPGYQQLFNVSQAVPLRLNVTSDCAAEGAVSGAFAGFDLLSPNSTWEACGSVVNESGGSSGYYNCSFNSSLRKEGNWSLLLNASRGAFNANSTLLSDWFVLDDYQPLYSAMNVSPLSGGWTRQYNYAVDVSDVANDSTTCRLFVSTDGQGSWSYKGNSTVASGTGTCLVGVGDFAASEIGVDNYYRFELVDRESANTFNTTAYYGPNLTASGLQIQYVSGNASSVNRTGANSSVLVLRVYDTDNSSYVGSGINASVWATTDGASYAAGNETTTNSSGYFTIAFNPSCAYAPGVQKWTGGVVDSRFAATNSSEYDVSVFAGINSSLVAPTVGQEFLRGTNVSIRANLSDECGAPVPSATVLLNVSKAGAPAACTGIIEEGSGIYNCSYNTSTLLPQYYNVTLYANRTYYNSLSNVSQNAFWVETRPELYSENVTPQSGGWSEQFTYSVNASDADNDTLNVMLWERSYSGSWTKLYEQAVTSTSNATVAYNKTFGSNAYVGTRQFKWNVTEDDVWNATAASHNYSVDVDDISFELTSGNGSYVYRPTSDSVMLSVRVRDADSGSGSYVGGALEGRIWITRDGSNYTSENVAYTSGAGFLNITPAFDPDCTFATGQQRWKAEFFPVAGKYAGGNSSEYYVFVNGSLVPSVAYPNGTYFYRGQGILLRANLTDECANPVSGAAVDLNASSGGENYVCPAVEDEGTGWYNCTIPGSSTQSMSTGIYNVSFGTSKQYYYPPASTIRTDSFNLTAKTALTNPNVNIVSGGWGRSYIFNVTAQDPENDYVNVTLWKQLGAGSWELLNYTVSQYLAPTTVSFTQLFGCQDIGSNNYKFNSTDASNNTNETAENSFTAMPDEVSVEFSQGIGKNITREGNDNDTFKVQIYDSDRAAYVGSAVNTTFWVTTNNADYDSGYATQTDASGYATDVFDPGCAHQSTAQKWKAGTFNDACYIATNSSTFSFRVKGQLKNNVTQPSYGTVVPVGDSVLFKLNVTSECNEGRDNAAATLELASPSGATEQCTPTSNESNGIYNCTWNTALHQGGNWTVRVNSSENEFFQNSTTFTNYIYLNNTAPQASNFNATPSLGGWSETFSFTAYVNDSQGDNVQCTLWTNTTGTWVQRGTTNVTDGQGNCTVNVSQFNCMDIGAGNEYKFELFDGTNSANTTAQTGYEIEANDVQVQYVSGNASSVNRTGTNSTPLFVRVYNLDNSSYVPGGVNASIWITVDGSAFVQTDLQTNGSGYINYTFDPDCSYAAGRQKWQAGVSGEYCYKATNATGGGSEYNVSVWADLSNNVQQPDTDQILNGTDVYILGKAIDDCAAEVDGAAVEYASIHNNTATRYGCSPTGGLGGGLYNCSQPTALMQAQWYHIEMNSSKEYHNNASATQTFRYFLKTAPLISNPVAATSLGGWGETFPFNVTAYDPDGDTLTIRLNLRSGGEWVEANSTTVDATTPVNVTLSTKGPYGGFSCPADLGVWEYNFTVDDTHEYHGTTSAANFTVEKDDVSLSYVYGNNSQVFRNSTHTTLLALYASDTDNGQPVTGGENSSIWVTTDGGEFDLGTYAVTNSTGYINVDFDPTCTHSVGIQKWRGGVQTSQCYKDSNSTNYSATVLGDLRPAILSPGGEGFQQNTYIPVSGEVRDDCSLVSGATFTYKMMSGVNAPTCTNTTNGNGTYNCTFLRTSPMGWWNSSLNVSKSYYSSNWTFKQNAFFLASAPTLSGPSVDRALGGWGETWKFEVRVTDSDLNTNNVSLWKSFDNSSWEVVESKSIPTPQNSNATFWRSFTCGDLGANYYKFTTNDQFNNSAETAVQGITVEKDDVSLSVSNESNSTVRRYGANSSLLKFRIYDSDNSSYPSGVNGTIMVTQDGSAYSVSYNCTTASGYCETTHDPDCSTGAAVQRWVGSSADSCYKGANATATNLTVYGTLYENASSPLPGMIINRNTTQLFNATTSDDCGTELSNATITWRNQTGAQLSSGYNATWLLPSSYQRGPATITANATLAYHDYYANSTSLTVYGWSSITAISPPSGSAYTASGIPVEITCTVVDNGTSLGIASYSVNFYKNGTLHEGSVNTNSLGVASTLWSIQTESPGAYNFSCAIADYPASYYNASLALRSTELLLLRSLNITGISHDSLSAYRNNSYSPHNATFTVVVADAQIGPAENTTVWLYNETGQLDSCTTNSTGGCQVTYDPHDTITPGEYVLFFNATKAGFESSQTENRTATVDGVLVTTITSPANGTFISKVGSVNLSAAVSDENGNSPIVTLKWFNETSQIASGSGSNRSLIDQATGVRNITASATRQYYDDGNQSAQIIVSGLADAQMHLPLDGASLAFNDTIPVSCKVKDHDTEGGIASYNATLYYNTSPGYVFLANATTNASGYANYDYTPTQKGAHSFKCEIRDDTEKYYSAYSPSSIVDVNEVDGKPPQITFAQFSPNQTLEANLNATTINATITDDSAVYSAWAQIGLPNGTIVQVPMSNYSAGNYSATYMPLINGTHNVTVYAQDSPPEQNTNSSFVGTFESLGLSEGALSAIPATVSMYNLTQYGGYAFELAVNYSNNGPGAAIGANLSVLDPSGRVSYNESSRQCGRIEAGGTCEWSVRATVSAATSPQTIQITSDARWKNPDLSTSFVQNSTLATVASNPIVNATPNTINATIAHGTIALAGTIIVEASGNDYLTSTELSTIGGDMATRCPGCAITMSPSAPGTIAAGTNVSVNVTVSVPSGQAPGYYWTYVRANTSNAAYDDTLLNVSVTSNSTWTRTPSTFGTVVAPLNTTGAAGNITITNIGNTPIEFNLSIAGGEGRIRLNGNSIYALILQNQSSAIIEATYDVTNGLANNTYPVTVYLVSSGAPASQNVSFTLNVTDTPPQINAFALSASSLETGYENATAIANVTDNYNVSSAWLQAALPNSTVQTIPMQHNGTHYVLQYNASQQGNYSISACANDSNNNQNCSAPLALQSVANTALALSLNASTIEVGGITQSAGANASVLASVSNGGLARALSTMLYANASNAAITPNETAIGILNKTASSATALAISVPAGTAPGNYSANVTANWTNINGTPSSASANFTVSVLSNPVLSMDANASAAIGSGTSGTVNFTVNATGNANLSGITFTCVSGVVCSEFQPAFSNNSFNLSAGGSLQVNATINVTAAKPAGFYYGAVYANSSQNASAILNISVQVPNSMNWTQSPSAISVEMVQGTPGALDLITVSNIGNQVAELSVSASGNASPYLSLSESSISIPLSGYRQMQATFFAPQTNSEQLFIANVSTRNENASPQQRGTQLSVLVRPFFLNITSPSENSPQKNVTAGTWIAVLANVTYAGAPLNASANVSFNATLQRDSLNWTANSSNSSAFRATFDPSSGLWLLNFSAPSIANKSYDINVSALYIGYSDAGNSSTNFSVRLQDAEALAVEYRDTTAPQLAIGASAQIVQNTVQSITLNATDFGTVEAQNVFGNVTDSNGTIYNASFSYSQRSGDTYGFNYNFSSTSATGTYTVRASACDAYGNCNTTSRAFEVKPAAFWAGAAFDYESSSRPLAQQRFMFYDSNGLAEYDFSSNSSTGLYNQTVFTGTHKIRADAFNSTLNLSGVPIAGSVYNPLVFGRIPPTRIGFGAVEGIRILNNASLSYSQANVSFNYSALSGYADEEALGIYYCSNWTQYQTCQSVWTRNTSAIHNLTTHTITLPTSNLSQAYALAEYVCGNAVCEAAYGESIGNCPSDCATATPTPAPSSGTTAGGAGAGSGSGGGGGSGAGAGAGAGTGGAGSGTGAGAGTGTGSGGGEGNATTRREPSSQLEVKATLIYVTLAPGEQATQSMDLINNLDSDYNATVRIEGAASEFAKPAATRILVPAKTTKVMPIYITTSKDSAQGSYSGEIAVKFGNTTYRTPITIKVQKPPTPRAEVRVKPLVSAIAPGEAIKFETSVVNTGETPSIEEIAVRYIIRSLEDDKEVSTTTETISVEDSVTKIKSIKVPANLAPGKYSLTVEATYASGNATKTSQAFASFEVAQPTITGMVFSAFATSWIPYLAIGLLGAAFVGRRVYKEYQDRKRRSARFIFPLDFKKLPQPGPTSIPVGKIAETDVKTYLDTSKLLMHTIAAGGTGSGKSVSAQVCAEELLKRNIPVVVFDPTAQWTGFIRPCKDGQMFSLYKNFGMKPEEARGFKTNIIVVDDPNMTIKIGDYMRPGEMTVFVLNQLPAPVLDGFCRRSIESIFESRPQESKELKLMLIYDEVHRLLPKYGGKGAYLALERGCREFRKWGIAIFMISQVLLDFKGAIRTNIANEIQLRTRYEGDIGRVKTKYGAEYSARVTKLMIGTGLFQNAEYNDGKPWFISFRPLLHSTFALTDDELRAYAAVQKRVTACREQMAAIKAGGKDTYDLELELNIASDKLKQGMVSMSQNYLESVEARLKK